jgi:3-phosphoshikimate 1-carboxyvinyltransferase
LSEAPVTIDGTARMRERPIGPLLAALSDLGATVETRDGFPPVTVRRGGLHGGAVSVDMSISSQFMSAVLMISPVLGEPVEVEMSGAEPVSVGYLTSTIEVMEAFGAEVEVGDGWFAVAPTGYRKAHYTIEPDASAAAYPLVAAAVTGGSVVIEGMPPSSTQPDIGLVAVLERMGCRSEWAPQGLVLHGPPEGLRGVDADMTNAPDAALALAVATAFAGGPSRIRGLGTLRLKETDRLSALEAELTRMGVEARIDGDDLIVVPGPMRPARIETYDDHRMAMSFAIAGLVTPGIEILDPGCVSKTWPEFFEMLEGL